MRLRIRDRNEFWTPLRNSTHIWAAPLPRGLAPGIHRLEVRAVDEYGQVHREERLVEIVDYSPAANRNAGRMDTDTKARTTGRRT